MTPEELLGLCLMCLGAAMALGIAAVFYGLESPSDGAADVAAVWRPARPDMPFSQVPPLTGGIRRIECREQFARYVAVSTESGLRRWAQTLADIPD